MIYKPSEKRAMVLNFPYSFVFAFNWTRKYDQPNMTRVFYLLPNMIRWLHLTDVLKVLSDYNLTKVVRQCWQGKEKIDLQQTGLKICNYELLFPIFPFHYSNHICTQHTYVPYIFISRCIILFSLFYVISFLAKTRDLSQTCQ